MSVPTRHRAAPTSFALLLAIAAAVSGCTSSTASDDADRTTRQAASASRTVPGASTSSAPASSAPASSAPASSAPASSAPASSAPASSAPASSAPASSATPAPVVTAVVLGSGDVLIHPPVWAQAQADARAAGRSGYDFTPMLASIAPDVRPADVATCELETPLAAPGGPFVGYPNFSAPPQVLTAIKQVGYTSCTTASNHSLDGGRAGVDRTLNALDAAGLRHTGSARTAGEAARPVIVTLPNGVRVGQLAYAFGFNGHQLPAGEPWLANLTDVPAILAAAHRMKQAGADIVVLSMHWGTEYDHLATSLQREQARELLASPDIDVILGDHAHVIQPAQRIDGKWVFYCMGDQISEHADPIMDNREGVMPRITFTETSPHHFRATRVEAIGTWVDLDPAIRLVDLPRALSSVTVPAAKRREYTAARAAIARYLNGYGAQRDGLIVR